MRTLGVFALILVVLGGIMAWKTNDKPKLALDLSSGTTVTLTAETPGHHGSPSDKSMQEAINIIRQRVNGSGVSESQVSKQGDNNIVVAVPGEGQKRVVDMVGTTAQLRFRQVLLAADATKPTTPQPSSSPSGKGATQSPKPSSSPTPKSTHGSQSKAKKSPAAVGDNAGSSPWKLAASTSSTRHSSGTAIGGGVAAASADSMTSAASQRAGSQHAVSHHTAAKPADKSSGGSKAGSSTKPKPSQPQVPATQQQSPTAGIDKSVLTKFEKLNCKAKNPTHGQADKPSKPIVACDQKKKVKYLLAPAKVEGKSVTKAVATVPQNGVSQWQVDLSFNNKGTQQFANLTRSVVSQQEPRNMVAVVLDGRVVSAPRIDEPITGGNAQITGSFTQSQAQNLANILKYGALPLKFDKSSINSVSPTLGRNQLDGGLLAGALGLALVVAYSFIYYRGLAIVSVLSLAGAGVLTYEAVVLLGEFMNFRLSLSGIAGIIVAVGITADSFIVFFERLRDEAREGNSVRTAVERGWRRARRTILVADAVSFIAAFVLYIVSVSDVQGFAFTLGLTTLVDVVVVFAFTKPMVTTLVRTRFYGRGHPLSGLDPRRLGAKRRPGLRRVRRTTPEEA